MKHQEDYKPLSFEFSGQTLEEYKNSPSAEVSIIDENGEEVLED